MSFREKSAWVTLIAILLVSGMYVLHVGHIFESSRWALFAMMASIATFVAIFISIHLHRSGAHAVGASVLLAFIVAEVVNYSARIIYYRRHR